jgi:hypothetical protein
MVNTNHDGNLNNAGKSGNELSLIFNYLEHRKTIGILGMAFPIILLMGGMIVFRIGGQVSISAYYHTGMRDVFVGILWAIGIFLLSYKGYDCLDRIVSVLGCIFAVGITLFPVGTGLAGKVHLACAFLFFSTLIFFSLVLFPKTNPKKTPTTRKLQRNIVYKICGYTMMICILLIIVYFLLPDTVASLFETVNPVFWLETIAIFFFGISWFTKGEAILWDKVLNPEDSG